MSFQVGFYTVNKKENSTKLPDSSSYSYTCNLKAPSGIVNPTLEIAFVDGTTNPSDLNYCYIPSFGRYYWIDEWTWTGGYWTCSCRVDVLATYKAEIGISTVYVLRSQSNYDNNVVDSVYPAKYGVEFASAFGGGLGWVNTPNPNTGTYVIGIVNNDDSVAGGVSYYALTGDQMAQFRAYMLQEIVSWDEIKDFSGDVAKAFIDPFQYVVSCLWFPFEITGGAAKNIKFGFWTSDIEGAPLTRYSMTFSTDIAFPDRAAPDDRKWLYLAPFATYYLYAMPFGIIPIDPTAITAAGLTDTVVVDLVTGIATLQVLSKADSPSTIIAHKTANVGVQIQLSQISTDYTGLSQSNGGGLISNIVDKLGGSIVGAIDALVNGYSASGIASSAQAGAATVQTSGSSGGMAAVVAGAAHILYAKYLTPVDEDIERFGRPLCKNVRLGTLSGFVLCGHGDIDIPGTAEEIRQVREYLEGGFYYE